MAFIDYIPYDQASPELKSLYEELGAPKRHPGNVLQVSGINPPVLDGHVALYRAVMMGRSPLTRQQREMIAVVVSGINECHY
jgi:alkylhydroperoxidase family enzyme